MPTGCVAAGKMAPKAVRGWEQYVVWLARSHYSFWCVRMFLLNLALKGNVSRGCPWHGFAVNVLEADPRKFWQGGIEIIAGEWELTAILCPWISHIRGCSVHVLWYYINFPVCFFGIIFSCANTLQTMTWSSSFCLQHQCCGVLQLSHSCFSSLFSFVLYKTTYYGP